MVKRVLIVDDEEPARSRLRRLLTEFPDVEIVGEATDGVGALRKINSLGPDIVFLDIEMPLLSGLEVAAAVDNNTKIVFATAYDEYAVAAFEQNAVDYLLKPIEKPRLVKCLERLVCRGRTDHPQLLTEALARDRIRKLGLRAGQKIIAIDIDHISLLKVAGEYTEIVAGEERHLSDDSLTALCRRLPTDKFLRIHRNAIINIDFLKSLRRTGDRKYCACLNDYFESETPVARDSLPSLRRVLGM